MKVYAILNDFISSNINKKAGDWDDIANIPDIADVLIEDNNQKKSFPEPKYWETQLVEKSKEIEQKLNSQIAQQNYKKIQQ